MDDILGAVHANPWATSVIDLPELNQLASAMIEERIGKLRDVAGKQPAQLRSESLVLLGPPGTGKTHLFSRVRKRLGPRAIFVHIRPLLHAGLTPTFVLSQAVQQLAQSSYGRPETQADMLVGSLIGYLEDQSTDFPTMNISAFRELGEAERRSALEKLTDKLFEVFPDLDDVFVERLLALPFATARDRRALLAWLSGCDCDPTQLVRIGAAASMDPGNAVRALRTLTSLAALGAPLVIVFDQLENLVQRDGTEERITQYGNLVAELVDSTRGLLVVQLALDSEWEQAIAPLLNLSQRSRLMMAKAALSLPTSKQSRSLVELWCEKLHEPGRAFPWPLNAEQLECLCALPGVTPRMLLSALKEALEGSEPSILQATPVPEEPGTVRDEAGELAQLLAGEWSAQVSAAHEQLDEADRRGSSVNEGRLRDALQVASSFAKDVALKAASDTYIQLEPQVAAGKWVCLLHQSHYRSVQAALDRVLAKRDDVLVVREQWRAFPPTWKTVADRQVQVMSAPRLGWHELLREEAALLLAIEAFLQLARSRDICDSRGVPVTEEQVLEFLKADVHPEQWPVIVRLTGETSMSPGASGVDDAILGNLPVEAIDVGTRDDVSPAGSSRAAAGDSNADEEVTTGDVAGVTIVALILSVLTRLRVASVDRVIREVYRLQAGVGRTAVVSGLEALGDHVVWFGRSIVALQEDAAETTSSGATETKREVMS